MRYLCRLVTPPNGVILDQFMGSDSAAKANKAPDKAGLLEQRFRKSSNGEKAFWSVTEKGLNYGKNITSPHNQRETQPHWYVSKKEDLVNIIKNNVQ